jgi:enoyl-CoA hydratase/carnithine racemase
MSSNIVVTQDAGVVTLRLDRPEKKNALTRDMYAALGDAIEKARTDDTARVILLCANGESFTAGNDLADFASRPMEPPRSAGDTTSAGTVARASVPDGSSPANKFLVGIAQCEKPIVAAVDGWAVGVGLTMLLHCDLVYLSTRAKLRAPFVDLGLIPEAASTLLLPRLLGHARAAQLFLLGEELDARRALEWGLVNDVLPPAELEAHALKVCQRLAAKTPSALRHTKTLLRDTEGSTLERMQKEFEIFAAQLRSPETQATIRSFFEKPKK